MRATQKIRTGLVELRTNDGSVYVSPSFWERIYLLWTFRNFHSLPKQVLNRHQQQLIDKLCRAEILSRSAPIARTCIIGRIENVYLKRDCSEKAATTGMLVEMSAASANAAASRAVGSEGISIRSSRAVYNRTGFGRFRRKSGKVQNFSAPKQESVEQREAKEASLASVLKDASRTWRRNRVGWALVSAGAALLGILFYFRERRLTPSVIVSQVAIEAHKPATRSVLSAVIPFENVQQSLPAERTPPAAIIQPPSPAVSSGRRQRSQRKTVVLSQLPVATKPSTPAERLQVAESPKGGFSYPVAPIPTLTGKVSLKAVIGIDGTVRKVDVLSGNRALAAAASRAVRHWQYRPHELSGHAIEVETIIAISFVGDDAVSISFPEVH
jgi:outer membrane biosynthesis protein TonB